MCDWFIDEEDMFLLKSSCHSSAVKIHDTVVSTVASSAVWSRCRAELTGRGGKVGPLAVDDFCLLNVAELSFLLFPL